MSHFTPKWLACWTALILPLAAAPGDLDASFGNGGIVTTSIRGGDDTLDCMLLQPDGKIVAAGNSAVGNAKHLLTLVRYNPNGSLDAGFGNSGIVTTNVGADYAELRGIALQSDGKIVVCGNYSPSNRHDQISIVLRYKPNGQLDGSFGSDGKVVTDFGGLDINDETADVAVQADGKIVVLGTTLIRDPSGDPIFNRLVPLVVRYKSDGSLDKGFGRSGKVEMPTGNIYEGRRISPQRDGKLLIAGQSYNSSDDRYSFGLARYHSNGTLDGSFGAGGTVSTPSGLSFFIRAMTVQRDGRILLGGESNGLTRDFALARYNANGTLDRTFGSGGKTSTDFGRSEVVSDAAVQANGKVVALGTNFHVNATPRIALARYSATGSLDQSFGRGGKSLVQVGSGAHGVGVTVGANGEIVVGATAEVGGKEVFAIIRFQGDAVSSLKIEPAESASFGTVSVGTTADLSFTIHNIGTLAISGAVSVSAPFSIVQGNVYTLLPGDSQTVVARFSPTIAGNYSANVTFTGGGGATRKVIGICATAGAIAGRVTAASNGQPIQNAIVSVNGSTVFTAADGTYRHDGLAPGTNYRVVARAQTNTLSPQASPPQTVTAGPPTTVDFALEANVDVRSGLDPKDKPVVLVRGRGKKKSWAAGESEYWQALREGLRSAGYTEVWECNEPEDGIAGPAGPAIADGDVLNGELGISLNAKNLDSYLKAKLADYYSRREYYPREIQIVAHSMGGLITRQMLGASLTVGPKGTITVSDPASSKDVVVKVEQVIMLGTPNAGSVLSEMAAELLYSSSIAGADWDSTKDLLPSRIRWDFNSVFPWPRAVHLYLLAGTGGADSQDGDLNLGHRLMSFRNLGLGDERVTDGAVPMPSVSGIHYVNRILDLEQVQTFKPSAVLDEVDIDVAGVALDHFQLMSNAAVTNWVKAIVSGNPPLPSFASVPAQSIAEAAPTLAEPELPPFRAVAGVNGVVSASAPTAIDAPCDAATSLRFDAFVDRAGMNFTLRTPSGGVVDPASAVAGSGITFTENVEPVSGARIQSYEITGPAVGGWQAVLSADGAGDGASYRMTAAVASTVVLVPNVATTIAAGEDVAVQAELFDTSAGVPEPVASATMNAKLIAGDGTTAETAMLDDGLHGDGDEGDGIYGVVFPRPAAAGTYRMSLRANGTRADGAAFQRVAEVETTLSPGGASIVSGSVQRQLIDLDGDGKADRLRLQCAIAPTAAGSYVLSGELTSPDGAMQLNAAETFTDLPAGTTTVNLYFDLQPLIEADYAGELVLSKLQLFAEDSAVPGWLDQYREDYRLGYSPQLRLAAQPQAASIDEGGAAVFSVVVEGTGTVQYQWRRNGQDIPGEIGDTLVIEPTALSQTGEEYSVAVSDETATLVSDPATLTVRVVQFAPFKGAYRGAIRPLAMSHDHSGHLTVNLSARGTFTAVAKLGGKTYRVRGAFGATGAFSTTLPGTTLALALQLDVNRGTNEITGTIKQGDTLIANLSTDRAPGGLNARNPVPFAGRYTLLLPPEAAQTGPAYPQGTGFGSLMVAATGAARLSGVLGDATAFGTGGVLSEDGELAVYALLYGKRGSLSGWLTVRDASATNHIEGTLDWSKPATGVGLYPLGFAGQTVVAGSRYARSLSLFEPATTAATLAFTAGDVTTNPATKDLLINAQGKVSIVGSERFKMTLAPASGLFSGTFTDTGGKPRSFRGAVLQEQDYGTGLFRGVEETGGVELQPVR